MEIFKVKTKSKEEIVDITGKVKEIIKDKKGKICFVYVKHTTAAIIINENYDKNVCEDILNCLNKLIPCGIWKHNCIDDNAAAHIKASILGPSEIIPVKNGKLELGKWQGIGLVELDGPREREVVIEIL